MEIAASALKGVSLTSLDLGFNNLDALPESLLRGQDKLQYLILQDNEISTLPQSLLVDAASLKALLLQVHVCQCQQLGLRDIHTHVNLCVYMCLVT